MPGQRLPVLQAVAACSDDGSVLQLWQPAALSFLASRRGRGSPAFVSLGWGVPNSKGASQCCKLWQPAALSHGGSLPPAAAAAAIAIVIIPPAAVLGLGPLAPMLITILRIYTPTDLADAPRHATQSPRTRRAG